jgi:hypothetical protein
VNSADKSVLTPTGLISALGALARQSRNVTKNGQTWALGLHSDVITRCRDQLGGSPSAPCPLGMNLTAWFGPQGVFSTGEAAHMFLGSGPVLVAVAGGSVLRVLRATSHQQVQVRPCQVLQVQVLKRHRAAHVETTETRGKSESEVERRRKRK